MQVAMDSMGNMKSETRSDRRSDRPLYLPRPLFPGPLVPGVPLAQARPFPGPDPLVLDMVKTLSKEALTHVQRSHMAQGPVDSCLGDIAAFCAHSFSPLLCLGGHANKGISEACRRDVDKSVPFRCSRSIREWCSAEKGGILPCLDEHLDDVDSPCRSAVAATQHLLKQFSLAEVHFGRKAESKPTVEVPVDAEANFNTTIIGDLDVDTSTDADPASAAEPLGRPRPSLIRRVKRT